MGKDAPVRLFLPEKMFSSGAVCSSRDGLVHAAPVRLFCRNFQAGQLGAGRADENTLRPELSRMGRLSAQVHLALHCKVGKRGSLDIAWPESAVQKENDVSCLTGSGTAAPCCAFIRTPRKHAMGAADYPLNCAAISETMFRHAVIIFIEILLSDNFLIKTKYYNPVPEMVGARMRRAVGTAIFPVRETE